jgi:hypothetical protein
MHYRHSRLAMLVVLALLVALSALFGNIQWALHNIQW